MEQGIQQIALLPAAQRDIVLAAYRTAIGSTFLAGAIVAVFAFAIILYLPEKPLQTARPLAAVEVEPLSAEMAGPAELENAG